MKQATYTERYGKSDWIKVEELKKSVQETYMTQLVDLAVLEKLMDEATLNEMDKMNESFIAKIGTCPTGAPESKEVLDWKHASGVIMQEQKAAIRACKIAWVEKHLNTWF
jgi:hypothetical protein